MLCSHWHGNQPWIKLRWIRKWRSLPLSSTASAYETLSRPKNWKVTNYNWQTWDRQAPIATTELCEVIKFKINNLSTIKLPVENERPAQENKHQESQRQKFSSQ